MPGPSVWRSATLVSAAVLLVVLSQVEWAGLAPLLRQLDWALLASAVCLLVLEALASSIRIWWLSDRRLRPGVAIAVNAWYMLYLIILPARLGEIAAIGLLQQKLGQTAGAATGSIVFQRMFDLLVLATGVLVVTVMVATVQDWLVIAFGVLLLTLMLARLSALLTLCGRCLQRWSGVGGIRQKLLRLVLQAKSWSRRYQRRGTFGLLLALTLVKWLASLVGLALILRSVGIGLEPEVLLALAILYVFLSIVPLQGLAGVGVSDVGLLALLVSLGIDSGAAAAATLFCRLVLILFTIGYAGLVLLPGGIARG